jgi:hypothetical protein
MTRRYSLSRGARVPERFQENGCRLSVRKRDRTTTWINSAIRGKAELIWCKDAVSTGLEDEMDSSRGRCCGSPWMIWPENCFFVRSGQDGRRRRIRA